ncbi:MAG: VWA domain-containing protein [Proteobacteria bacterium]|nr:VWA domain-containing protein [Pseudomonadota bacterium]
MRKSLLRSYLVTFLICSLFLPFGSGWTQCITDGLGEPVPGEPGAFKRIFVPYQKVLLEQSQPVNVGVSQIEVTDFPSIHAYVRVTNESGQRIEGLTAGNFTLTEQSQAESAPVTEQITSVEEMAGQTELNVALVIDTSGSMDYSYGSTTGIEAAKLAAKTFIDGMGANDKACLISFADDAVLFQTLTSDKEMLKNAVEILAAVGWTAMYDGVYLGLEQLSGVSGVKALIVLADGDDNYSWHTSTHVIDYAKTLGVPIYSIGLGSELDPSRLQDLSDNTGGYYKAAPSATELQQLYFDISQNIRNQYRITFTTHNAVQDDKERTVTVTASTISGSDSGTAVYRSPFVKLWVDIVGRDQIRPGRSQDYWIRCGNSGNIDAFDIILWVAGSSGLTIETDATTYPGSTPGGQVIEGDKVIKSIWLYRIPPSSDRRIKISVKMATELNLINLEAGILRYLSPPLLTIPQSTNSQQFSLKQSNFIFTVNTDNNEPPVDGVGYALYVSPANKNPGGHMATYAGNGQVYDHYLAVVEGEQMPMSFDSWRTFWEVKDGAVYMGYGKPQGYSQEKGYQMVEEYKHLIDENVPFDLFGGKGGGTDPVNCFGAYEGSWEKVSVDPIPNDSPLIWTPGFSYMFLTGRYDFYEVGATLMDPGLSYYLCIGLHILLHQFPQWLLDNILKAPGVLKQLVAVTSYDPNDKAGPAGFGTQHFLPLTDQQFLYVIYFENMASATAPAEDIQITDHLSANLDWTWFQFAESSHPNVLSTSFDPYTGIATWEFIGINLPPNVNSPEGEGWVSFTIKPKKDLPTGTQIKNKATIDFEIGYPPDPIDTPEVINTIDSQAPTSSISSLADEQPEAFTLSWSGSDGEGGSGIQNYSIYVSDNGAPYQPLISSITETSAQFTGEVGHSYSFYSIAADNVGNVEPQPNGPDRTVLIHDTVTLSATSFPKQVNRPFFRNKRCLWLSVQCPDGGHFNEESIIAIEGEANNFGGVEINQRRDAFKKGKFIFIPVCVGNNATIGKWDIKIITEFEEGGIPFEENIEASFMIK